MWNKLLLTENTADICTFAHVFVYEWGCNEQKRKKQKWKNQKWNQFCLVWLYCFQGFCWVFELFFPPVLLCFSLHQPRWICSTLIVSSSQSAPFLSPCFITSFHFTWASLSIAPPVPRPLVSLVWIWVQFLLQFLLSWSSPVSQIFNK